MTWIITALLLLAWPALGHLFWLLLAVVAGLPPGPIRVELRPIRRLGCRVMADDDTMATCWTLCVLAGPLAVAAVPFLFWLFDHDA